MVIEIIGLIRIRHNNKLHPKFYIAPSTDKLLTPNLACASCKDSQRRSGLRKTYFILVVVKITVPFWVPTIIRHLIFRVSKKNHQVDNHPYDP